MTCNIQKSAISLLYFSSCWLAIALLAPQFAVADVPQPVQRTAQQMLHVLDYIAVDYAALVQEGIITNEDEYREQLEFAGRLVELARQLPDSKEKPVFREKAEQLRQEVEQKSSGEKVAAQCNSISLFIIKTYEVGVAPRSAPPLHGAAALFQENCSACHGLDGYGGGPNAAGLQPPPANFHQRDRQRHRSVFSLYNTISLGVAGTAMPAFDTLTNEQRWQLAFYVSDFFATDAERARGKAILAAATSQVAIGDLRQLTQTTPAQIAADYGDDGVAELAYLRSNPAALPSGTSNPISPLQTARDNLAASLAAYEKGDNGAAYDLAVAAYLEGFELVETQLKAVAPKMRRQTEQAMMQYREMIKHGAAVDEVQQANTSLLQQLDNAAQQLRMDSVSSTVNFLSALLILLREGIEAILILAAIAAVMTKTGRREGLRYLHYGWIAALAVGGLTWYVAGTFINISGAGREMTEAVTALVAAAMLIYVGFWLHKQSYAIQWQHFIRSKVTQSLTKSALSGLAVVAFLAVYREVFESILFFQTLWLQSDASGHRYILSGMATAVVLLALVAWGVFTFSMRLPLKLFFSVNSVLLYALAIVFAGKGVTALQGAGKLPVNPVNFFEIDALGIYPNAESLGAQAVLIAVALILFFFARVKLSRSQSNS